MIIRFFAHLQEITGTTENVLDCQNAMVKDILEELSDIYGESFEKIVFDDKGDLYLKILINGRNIDYLDGLNSKVVGDDIVAIFPPVAGG